MNMEKNNGNTSFLKQTNSTVYQSFDVGFQKNIHNSLNFEIDQNVLTDNAMKQVLNESYTVSNVLNKKNLLTTIYEESGNLTNSSNIFCSRVSAVNKSNNAILSNQIVLQQHDSSTKSVNKVSESHSQDFKERKEEDISDSDESLGILPSAVLEDSDWDDLMNYEEKNQVNLNTTRLINNVDMEILNTENIMVDSSFAEVFLPVCHVLNETLLNNQEVESPIQNDSSLPKYASTPKHETNFSDLSYEIENALNLTHNLSFEFHMNQTLLKQNEEHSTQQSNENMKSLSITQNSEAKTKNCLNLTFEKDLYQNSSATKSEVNYKISDFQGKSELDQRTEKLLNTTYEKELKNSSLNAAKRSEQFQLTMENNKKPKYYIKSSDTKSKTNFAKFESFTKNKLYRNKCRNSVGCLKNIEPLKVDLIGKQERRNSMSGNIVTSSKENILDGNVAKLSHCKNLPNHCFKQNRIANLVPNGKTLINTCTAVRKCNKSTLKNSILKSELSTVKSKIKTPNISQNNQGNVLNETINLAPSRNHLGKTVVKKPRSLNFACLKITSIGKCNITDGSENKVVHKNIIPLKFDKNMKPSEMECKVTNGPILKDRTTKDISVNSVVSGDRKGRIARPNDKFLPSETSALSCRINDNGLKRNCSVKAFKTVDPSKRTTDVSTSRKSLNKPKHNKINSVVMVSDQSTSKQSNAGFKAGYANIKEKSCTSGTLECKLSKPMKVDLNATILLSKQQTIEEPELRIRRASCIPLSKIPSIQKYKFDSQVDSSVSTDYFQKNIKKHEEKEMSRDRRA